MPARFCDQCGILIAPDAAGSPGACPQCEVSSSSIQSSSGDDAGQIRGLTRPALRAVFAAAPLAGRFRFERVLGTGTFGTVVLATERERQAAVAIKILNLLVDVDAHRRFIRERTLLDQVQHPNVLTMIESGTAADYPYIVTEYLSGGDLRNRMGSGQPWSTPEVIRIAVDCFAGLEACHQVGIVHRDLKPENILLTETGCAKIADLGIARWYGARTLLTRTGALMGTLPYMAPEQLRGDMVTTQTDLYAMGLILSELVGQPRSVERNPVKLLDLRSRRPSPLSQEQPGLSALLQRLLEPHPGDRPPSAAVVLDALDRIRQDTGMDTASKRSVGRPSERIVPPRTGRFPPATGTPRAGARRPPSLVVAGLVAVLAMAVAHRYWSPIAPASRPSAWSRPEYQRLSEAATKLVSQCTAWCGLPDPPVAEGNYLATAVLRQTQEFLELGASVRADLRSHPDARRSWALFVVDNMHIQSQLVRRAASNVARPAAGSGSYWRTMLARLARSWDGTGLLDSDPSAKMTLFRWLAANEDWVIRGCLDHIVSNPTVPAASLESARRLLAYAGSLVVPPEEGPARAKWIQVEWDLGCLLLDRFGDGPLTARCILHLLAARPHVHHPVVFSYNARKLQMLDSLVNSLACAYSSVEMAFRAARSDWLDRRLLREAAAGDLPDSPHVRELANMKARVVALTGLLLSVQEEYLCWPCGMAQQLSLLYSFCRTYQIAQELLIDVTTVSLAAENWRRQYPSSWCAAYLVAQFRLHGSQNSAWQEPALAARSLLEAQLGAGPIPMKDRLALLSVATLPLTDFVEAAGETERASEVSRVLAGYAQEFQSSQTPVTRKRYEAIRQQLDALERKLGISPAGAPVRGSPATR
jgi:serine/threonine protein kinase